MHTNPTQQILEAAQQIKCKVPLTSIDKCQYKYCERKVEGKGLKPHNVNGEKLDKYWSEFLQAQQDSSANYIFNIQYSSNNRDPTLIKKAGVPITEIRERVLKLSYTAGLSKEELFYLLSFLLNILKLPGPAQQQYMEHMLACNLLDEEIIIYLQMICQHPKVGLTETQQKDFQQILCQLKEKSVTSNRVRYYNPEHIFIKPFSAINPYELEYLNTILHNKKRLTNEQTLYLAQFVYKLQRLDSFTREEYLKFLRENHIMRFTVFECLVAFLVNRSKRPDVCRLNLLLRELIYLMDIEPCVQGDPTRDFEQIKKPIEKSIEIDYRRLRKALKHLMKSVIPNIVRLTDLRNFLKNLTTLDKYQIVTVLNELKIAKVLTDKRFKYLEEFITQRKMGKIDKAKKEKLLQLLKKMATEPITTGVILKLDIPAGKGPRKENFECKEVKDS